MRVLFISKPVAPPWNDGSKNLVRDLASSMTAFEPTVMSHAQTDLPSSVRVETLYEEAGGFSPTLRANARVFRRLVMGERHDVWHFVFAPNTASSSAARLAITSSILRGRPAVVQTIASAPRAWNQVGRLLFGDRIVAQSEWTRGCLLAEGVSGDRVSVIPPCACAPVAPPPEEIARVRRELGALDAPLFVYPGDYEVSSGADTVLRAAPALLDALPKARVVFACRQKTKHASAVRKTLEESAPRDLRGRVTHLGEVPHMHTLLAAAHVVLFPVDDLYGKVDIPLVLLEAMSLGTPLVLVSGGPLETLSHAAFVAPRDAEGLAQAAYDLATDLAKRRAQIERGRQQYEERFTPDAVTRRYEACYRELLSR